MFYKKVLTGYPTSATQLNQGNGFYLCNINGIIEVWLINGMYTYPLNLGNKDDFPREFLEFIEEKTIEDEPVKKGFISEDFALKAMAIAKANTQTIKISDIL